MCLDCGCGLIATNHGDKRHITIDDLSQAARANDFSLSQTIFNIIETLPKVVQQLPDSPEKSAITLLMSLMVQSNILTSEDVKQNNPQEPANVLGPLNPDSDTATDVTNVTMNPTI